MKLTKQSEPLFQEFNAQYVRQDDCTRTSCRSPSFFLGGVLGVGGGEKKHGCRGSCSPEVATLRRCGTSAAENLSRLSESALERLQERQVESTHSHHTGREPTPQFFVLVFVGGLCCSLGWAATGQCVPLIGTCHRETTGVRASSGRHPLTSLRCPPSPAFYGVVGGSVMMMEGMMMLAIQCQEEPQGSGAAALTWPELRRATVRRALDTSCLPGVRPQC